MIFVFGSNEAGRHGKGAAKYALDWKGAVYGQGVGRQGDSYAIPTKSADIKTLPLAKINNYVKEFLEYAKDNPDLKFKLTPIGCGLAGYEPKDIAPMFATATDNIQIPPEFKEVYD